VTDVRGDRLVISKHRIELNQCGVNRGTQPRTWNLCILVYRIARYAGSRNNPDRLGSERRPGSCNLCRIGHFMPALQHIPIKDETHHLRTYPRKASCRNPEALSSIGTRRESMSPDEDDSNIRSRKRNIVRIFTRRLADEACIASAFSNCLSQSRGTTHLTTRGIMVVGRRWRLSCCSYGGGPEWSRHRRYQSTGPEQSRDADGVLPIILFLTRNLPVRHRTATI